MPRSLFELLWYALWLVLVVEGALLTAWLLRTLWRASVVG